MNLPSLGDWFLAQTHRDDLVGSLAKLWAGSKSNDIEEWLLEQECGVIMKAAVDDARMEFARCVRDLQSSGHSESFPSILSAMSDEAAISSLASHRASPQITPEQYLHDLHKALRKQVESARRVYLDTNHWIRLLNVVLGRSRPDDVYATVLELLRELRGQKRLVCPCSYPLVHELLKQTDPNTRRRMAALIDELSGGISIQPPNQLERIELKRQMLRAILGPTAPDVGEWVWVKISAVAGEMLPVPLSNALPQSDVIAMRKVMIDHMWKIPLMALVEFSEASPVDPLEPLVQAYVKDAEDYRKHRVPFDRVMMDQKAIHLEQLLRNDFVRIAGEVERQFPEECAAAMKAQKVSKSNFSPDVLASVQIKAAVIASFIVSTNTKNIVVNDVIDAIHASVALPYFDAVCVDNGMAHRLKSAPLRFDKIYDVPVFSKADEILAWLNTGAS